jgi:hypothetical protein
MMLHLQRQGIGSPASVGTGGFDHSSQKQQVAPKIPSVAACYSEPVLNLALPAVLVFDRLLLRQWPGWWWRTRSTTQKNLFMLFPCSPVALPSCHLPRCTPGLVCYSKAALPASAIGAAPNFIRSLTAIVVFSRYSGREIGLLSRTRWMGKRSGSRDARS